jgi:hypothetical protein
VDHLAVGQAFLLVQFDDDGLGVGAPLRSGRPQGVGRLQRMAALDAAAAVAATADVDVELPVQGLARDLDLVLLGVVRLVHGAARVGKVFNTNGSKNMADPDYGGHKVTMLYAGDDAEANQLTAGLAA